MLVPATGYRLPAQVERPVNSVLDSEIPLPAFLTRLWPVAASLSPYTNTSHESADP